MCINGINGTGTEGKLGPKNALSYAFNWSSLTWDSLYMPESEKQQQLLSRLFYLQRKKQTSLKANQDFC